MMFRRIIELIHSYQLTIASFCYLKIENLDERSLNA